MIEKKENNSINMVLYHIRVSHWICLPPYEQDDSIWIHEIDGSNPKKINWFFRLLYNKYMIQSIQSGVVSDSTYSGGNGIIIIFIKVGVMFRKIIWNIYKVNLYNLWE